MPAVTPTVTRPEPVPGELLRAAADLRISIGRVVRRLRQQYADGELTPAALSVLARLDHDGPCGPAALAEAEQVTPPVVCASLATLQQRGLVHRGSDPLDGRRVVLSLTAAGRSELTARRSALSRRIAVTLQERFTAAEREQLLAAAGLLQRLAAGL